METKKLFKSLKRRLGLITTALAMLLVSQGMLASMTVTKGEVIIVDVSGHQWFSNDNCYPKVYIGSTVVGQAGGYSSTKSYSITITTTATGTMQISRFTGSNEYNKSNVNDRSNANQDKVSISGNSQWGGSWSNTKEYTYGQRYFYVDCTGFTSYPSVNCSFYWNNNCTDEAGYKKGMASCETNVYYHDLSTVSASSYTYIRSFQVSQGEWNDKSNHTPAQNNNTNNCVEITGWGKGSWTSYALTPSTVTLEVSEGASSGSGTSNDPYIVEPGAEFTLSASGVTYSPADPNMSTRYAFGTSASSTPTGTSSTSEQTASSTEGTTQYYVSVRGYYNSTYSKSYKSTSVYVQTKSACTKPIITASDPAAICGSGKPEMTASTTAGTIHWYSDAACTSELKIGTSYTPSTAISTTTKYYLKAIDGDCASDVKTLTATINPLPTASISGDDAVCQNGSLTLTGSGGTNYSWNDGGYSDTNTFTVITTSTGQQTITLKVKDDNNCESTETSKDVTVNAIPTAGTISASSATICENGSTELSATGTTTDVTYQWQKSTTSATEGFTDIEGAVSETYTASGLTADNYWFRLVVSKSDCNNTSNVAAVTVIASPAVSASPDNTTAYEVITLTSTSGSVLLWSKDDADTRAYFVKNQMAVDGNTVEAESVNFKAPAKGSTYTITAKNKNNDCESNLSITIGTAEEDCGN